MQGHALFSLLQHSGHHVEGVSHVGDFGLPLGLVIRQAELTNAPFMAAMREGDGEISDEELPSTAELARIYVDAKKRAKAEPLFAHEAAKHVRAIQAFAEKSHSGADVPLSVRVWRTVLRASRASYERVFNALNVSVEEKGESFYAPKIPALLTELAEKGTAPHFDAFRNSFQVS